MFEKVPENDTHILGTELADMEMLVMTDGGRERTEDEYRSLFEAAGLRLTRVHPTSSPCALWKVGPASG